MIERVWILALALVGTVGCSDPVDPCAHDGPAIGMPAFDLAQALRAQGAEVEELGQRLDLTLHSTGTWLLRVDGVEIQEWRYCSTKQLTQDLGLYGVGPNARTPPVIPPDDQRHLFTEVWVLAAYEGSDPTFVALMESAMGPELELPPEG